MKKSILKTVGLSCLMTMALSMSAFAASKPQYSYTLKNTGQTLTYNYSTANTKTYSNDPWTLSVTSISTGSSPYGMRFVPIKSTGVACSNSGVWRKTGQTADLTGRVYTYYGSGDTGTGTRYLGARIDDSYYPSNGYTSTGWWNADGVYN